MQDSPFKKQYLHFLKSSYNPQFSEEYLSGIDSISKYSVDKAYNSFLSKKHPLIGLLPNLREDLMNSDSIYTEFNNTQHFKQIWEQQPLLTSLVQTKIGSNRDFVESIVERIQKDEKLLRQEFKINDCTITNLEISKGDVHQNGKTTAIVTFANNIKLVYKPRTSGLDISFGELLKSFNLYDKSLQLKVLKFIDLEEYSWCEFVDNSPCSSEIEVEEYYQKTGVLLAFMFFLKGVDIHFENIIANGNNPVIIDLECLFHNSNVPYFDVLNTGMCPILSLNGFENSAVDLSGMGASGDIKMNRKEWKWVHGEKDALNLEQSQGFVRARGNMPTYKGEPVSPKKYLEQVLEGFDKAAQWVESLKEQIRANKPHPFETFQNKTFRIIPRATQDYTDILNNSFTPDSLVNLTSRKESIRSNLNTFKLNLPFLSAENRKRVLAAELTAIERLDIPYFTGNTSTLNVKESSKVVLDDYYDQTPYDRILTHILGIDQKEVCNQKNLITSSFVSCYDLEVSNTRIEFKVDDYANLNKYDVEIERIADQIINSATQQNNELNWNCFVEEHGTLVFNLLDNTLYSGKLGIAIFLSKASKHLATPKYDEIIKLIVENEISSYKSKSKEISISFASGLSGLIHTLMEVDLVLYEEAILKLSELITPEIIGEDEVLDIIGGSAGCLSVLCLLYKKTKSKRILSICLELGSHLMNKRVCDSVSQHKCWVSSSIGLPLTGYSHGAAGIGLSLLNLYEISKKVEFKEAFYEALDFENYYFVESENNWKDLRNNQTEFQNSWCHGAAGIGLARVEAYKILKDESLLIDLQRAIDGTINNELSGIDHYCCGNAGRFEFLIEALKITKSKELQAILKENIEALFLKKRKAGNYQTQMNSNISVENPSLYRGISGVGQMLIHLSQIL